MIYLVNYIDMTIRPPYDSYKSYDEQEYFYWNDVKDNIIVLSKVLEKDYAVLEKDLKDKDPKKLEEIKKLPIKNLIN